VPEIVPTQSPSSGGKIVTIFGSSKPKEGSPEFEGAVLIGERLALNGISVCTGGYRGTMEAVSKGASKSDVKIIGVTSAVFSPDPNEYVNVQVHTQSLFERLQKLVELGDGYMVLKGGTGTLVEFAMVWELMNKNIIAGKPIIAVSEFWKPMIDLLGNELTSEGLASCAQYVKIARDAPEAAEMMISSLLKK
jgi:uncharacterized protein (TIGR00725 family)